MRLSRTKNDLFQKNTETRPEIICFGSKADGTGHDMTCFVRRKPVKLTVNLLTGQKTF